MNRRVLFYVQHLLGIGHLRRAEALVSAMAAEGLDVTVALGSRRIAEVPFAGATVVQLPPAAILGEDFAALVDEFGQPVDEGWKARRREALFSAVEASAPDVVLFELFPFGRRQFRFELLPLLEALHARPGRPWIVSSVRDILVAPAKPGRAEETADIVRRWFDLVLVHGDEEVIPFAATFAPATRIADLIRYTGYVVAPAGGPPADGRGEVLVSSGGGAVGAHVFRAALAARPRTSLAGAVWRFLTGPDLPEAEFAHLAAHADDRTIVERFRPDFAARLAVCALSISQAGYNTTMDLLRSGAPAVVVPFEAAGQTEQRLRSDLLARKGLLTVVAEAELTAERLALAVEEALARPAPGPERIDLAGAATTARILAELAARPRAAT